MFSQIALQWFEMLPGSLPTLPGMSWAHPRFTSLHSGLSLVHADMLAALPGSHGLGGGTPDLSPAHSGSPLVVTRHPMSGQIFAGAPRCSWRPLHQSSTLRDSTTLRFWSDNSETLPEAPRDKDELCWCWKYTGRIWWCKLRGWDCTTIEMHWEAMIGWTWRWKCSKFGDTLGDSDEVKLYMHSTAVREQVRQYSRIPWMFQIWRSTWGRSMGGTPDAQTRFTS